MKQLTLYSIIISISLFTFFIFRPYKLIDHNKTKAVCLKNNLTYDIGPNLIFAFDEKLDPLTDKNVRKLCEYAIINDFADTYKTPAEVNYRIDFVYEREGSWGDAILISVVTLLSLILVVNKLGKSIISNFQIPISNQFPNPKFSNAFVILLGAIFFLLFLHKPAKYVYCERQIASRINNFKKSAYGFGLTRIQQEEPRMRIILNEQLRACLKS